MGKEGFNQKHRIVECPNCKAEHDLYGTELSCYSCNTRSTHPWVDG